MLINTVEARRWGDIVKSAGRSRAIAARLSRADQARRVIERVPELAEGEEPGL
jgi:hypothetical protein